MTDAELEQLIADKKFADNKIREHKLEVTKWTARWFDLTERINLAMQADNSEFVRQVKEG